MQPLIFLTTTQAEPCRTSVAGLEDAGYTVKEGISTEPLVEILELRPAAVLIDVSLRDRKGLDLCGAIRRNSLIRSTKIVLLTELSTDCIHGFNAGADDCLTRPVTPTELLARLDALLRPEKVSRTAANFRDAVLTLGDVELNLSAMRVSVAGSPVPTTILEFRLLEYMARNPGRVFTRDHLLDVVWGMDRFVTPRSVDACMRRIRHKVESSGRRASFLKTIRGVGYCLEAGFRLENDLGQRQLSTRYS